MKLTEDQQLIYEAMLIVAGESDKSIGIEHARAMFGERSDLVSELAKARDTLSDAVQGDTKWARITYRDVDDSLRQFEFLEHIDPKWVQKLTPIEVVEKRLREAS